MVPAMNWQDAIARWRKLPPETQTRLRWERIPKDVAASMAFEQEPVDQTRLETIHRQTAPPGSLKPPAESSATRS